MIKNCGKRLPFAKSNFDLYHQEIKSNKVRYYVLFFTLMGQLTFLNAQVQKLSTHQFTGSYQLDLIQGTLDEKQQEFFPENKSRLQRINVLMEQNELLINYQLENPEEQGYYVITLEVKIDEQNHQLDPAYLLGDLGKIKRGDGKVERKIIWTNLIAQLPDSKGILDLTFKAEYWGIQKLPYRVSCDKYPSFGFREKLPFYAGLVGGVGSLAAGVIIRNKAQDHLGRHREAKTLSERRNQYQEYTDKLEMAKIVSYVGVGILALDTFLYFFRKDRYKKQIEIFEKYCSEESLSVNPYWEPSGQGKPQQLGLHFSYQF